MQKHVQSNVYTGPGRQQAHGSSELRLSKLTVADIAGWVDRISSLCNTLQHTATYSNTLQHSSELRLSKLTVADIAGWVDRISSLCNTLQRTATHCNTLQHSSELRLSKLTVADVVGWVDRISSLCNTPQRTATHYKTLRNYVFHTATDTAIDTATYCNILQRAATYCNTLQHSSELGFAKFTVVDIAGWVDRISSPCNTLHRTATPYTTLRN